MNIETLNLLHETTIRCLDETDEKKIIGIFTELAISVLEADFGFVWMSKNDNSFELTYKSHSMPYTPLPPTLKGRNSKVFHSYKPDFVSVVHKRKDRYDVSKYMKSFVIIPIVYKDSIYGNIVICFKNREYFSEEKRISCSIVGTNIAQVMTILRNKASLKEHEEYRRKIEEEGLRTEFLADAMHELRTPLAIIKGTIDLAMRPEYALSKSIAIQSINTEILHLTEILSELDLLTSNNSPVNRKIKTKKINLALFIRKISKRWSPLANKKGIVIRITKIPIVSILGDESYLNKLFTNIIKNAINYGKDNGHIFISGMLEGDNVKIEIHDDGIGIAKNDIGRIFERFYRVDKSHSNSGNYNSTGLGLAITKWIAEAHGGSIAVSSTLGKGSTFSVVLPVL